MITPTPPHLIFLRPAPLTGYAKTRSLGFAAIFGCFSHTHGCRVQHRCTIVAPNVAPKTKQNHGVSPQVQRCNGFRTKAPLCAYTHTHARACVMYIICCTVAPLHLLYKSLISLKNKCNNWRNGIVAPLRLSVRLPCLNDSKALVLLDKLHKLIVYWGFI